MTRRCVLCAFDLEPTELMTCRACVTETRRDLNRIDDSFALLPSLLGHPAVIGFSTVMGVGAEAPLPGGDVLVMLGPASAATSWRHGDDTDRSGDPSDPPAVAFELAQWCEDWAGARGELSWPAVVPDCVDWLGARLEWASSHHMAFDDFAADLVRIRGRLEAVTGVSNIPEKGASCPYCGTPLERQYRDSGRRCSHVRVSWQLGLVPLPAGHVGPPRLETIADRDLRIALWESEHARCDMGGRDEDEDWSCRRCHRAFNDAQYRLALRASIDNRLDRQG